MLVYFLVAISPLVISYFYPKLNIDNKVKKRYLFACGIVLVLFIGLRSKYLGSEDSFNYYEHMQRALLCNSWDLYYRPNGFEIGFQLFVYCLSKITSSAQMLFIATAIIYISSILYCFYKNSDNVVLSIVMYITLGLMQFQIQGMRQAIAISICIFSFEFIKKQKFIPFALLIILAASFHRTAFLFVAVYFISYISYNWLNIILLLIGSGVVLSFADIIMNLANNVFETNYSKTIESGGFVATAIYLLIIVFAMLFYRKGLHKKNEKAPSVIIFVAILGAVSYIMRYFGIVIAERISFYFLFSQALLLPNTITHINKDYKKATNIVVYILCILLFLYRLQGNNFFPYKFFWNA